MPHNQGNQPKEFKIPSRSFGMTAEEGAQTLVRAQEIKNNKPFFEASIKIINKQLIAQKQAQLDAAKTAGKKT